MAIARMQWSNTLAVDDPVAFEQALPCGLCLGVRIPGGPDGQEPVPPELLARLDADEARHASGLQRWRQHTWVAGRVALRAALARMGIRPGAIWPNDRGAPIMPGGVVGSISHTRTLAVALVAEDSGWAIGVDIERRTLGSQDISRRVLTDVEREHLSQVSPGERGEAIMLRFSLKEAIYKAVDPFLRRYVAFREMSVQPHGDGTVSVQPHLERGGPLEIEAWWSMADGFVLTCARARSMCT